MQSDDADGGGDPRRPVIEVSHLRKTYGTTVAVDDVSFSVQEDEIVGILGPMFFGGLWLPRAAMLVALRDGSNLTPLGAAADAIQSALQTGFPPVTSLLVLVAYAVVFWGIAVRLFRWE